MTRRMAWTKKSEFRARDIGETIKRLRRRAGKSQSDVARLTGISMQTISNIEVGRVMPDLDSLCTIAAGIGVEPHVIVQHGLSRGSAKQTADRAEAMEILADLDPGSTKLALEQLRALQIWQRSNSKAKDRA